MEQLEIIPYQHVDGVRIFINKVEYRAPHFHPEWELIWVLDTPLSLTSGQQQMLVQPGELILFPPNYPHEFHKMERPSTFLCLQISNRLFPTTATHQTEDIRLKDHLAKDEEFRIRQSMINIARQCWEQKTLSELYCHGFCGLILYSLLMRIPSHIMTVEEADNMEQRNARLMRLLQFVDENYMHKIRLADFAQQEGRSLSHMSRFVRETMNQTFQEYVNSVRFNQARKLMDSGGGSLVSICAESGFSDYRYFSREFQKRYGVTPAEYRAHARTAPAENILPVQNLHSAETIYTPSHSLNLLKNFEEQLAAFTL